MIFLDQILFLPLKDSSLSMTETHRIIVIARYEAILMRSLTNDSYKIASLAEKAFSQ